MRRGECLSALELQRTGRSGRALLMIPPNTTFSLLITGSVVPLYDCLLDQETFAKQGMTPKNSVHYRAERRWLHRIRAFMLFQP
jgi:hypothetical protein